LGGGGGTSFEEFYIKSKFSYTSYKNSPNFLLLGLPITQMQEELNVSANKPNQ